MTNQKKEDCGCAEVQQPDNLQKKSLFASDGATYGYDSRGRLQTVTFANGTTHVYNYDAMGNRTSVVTTCPGGTC
jgi:YD repeat-containing protein